MEVVAVVVVVLMFFCGVSGNCCGGGDSCIDCGDIVCRGCSSHCWKIGLLRSFLKMKAFGLLSLSPKYNRFIVLVVVIMLTMLMVVVVVVVALAVEVVLMFAVLGRQ